MEIVHWLFQEIVNETIYQWIIQTVSYWLQQCARMHKNGICLKWSQRNHKYYNFCICNNIDQELCIAWPTVCFECGTVWKLKFSEYSQWHVLILWMILLDKLFSLLKMVKAPIIAFVNIDRTWSLTDIVVFTWVTKTSAHYKCEGDLHLTAKTLQMHHQKKKKT